MNDIELNCGNCEFFIADKGTHNERGMCRRNPPVVFPMPVPNQIAGQPPRFMWQSTFPPVNAKMACGEFLPIQQVQPELKPTKLEN